MIWRHYLALARGLAKQRFEASQRSAVSRAYYGAFNLSRRWLEANVTPIDNHRPHEQVWQTFRRAEHASARTRAKWERIGLLGDSLRTLRNQADYEDEVPEIRREAGRAVDAAEEILSLLAEIELGKG